MRHFTIILLCLSGHFTYGQKLVKAEYFIDKDPGPGFGIKIQEVTKSDSLNIKNIFISSAGLKEGSHTVGLRVKDSLGIWSPNYTTSFSILTSNKNISSFNQSKLLIAEYFIDKDPGPGLGTRIPGVSKSDSLNIKNINISSSGLKEGSHILGLRVKDSLGFWSSNFTSSFSILKPDGNLSSFNMSKLIQAEYFIDIDPGPGKGVKIPGILKSDSINLKNINIPSIGLKDGSHIVGFRVRDSLGLWSSNFITSFSILRGNSF